MSNYEVPPLAYFLAEEMQARGWQTEDVAARMGGERGVWRDLMCLDVLMCVQKDSLKIDDETFAGLAHAFDVSEEFFRNLDKAWREAETRAAFEPPESLFGEVSRNSVVYEQ